MVLRKPFVLWIIAFIITIASAFYQRVTGPTYEVKNKINIEGKEISYILERSHSTSSDYKIEIYTGDKNIGGELYWKRYKTNDDYTKVEMKYHSENLNAILPAQPSAGKLQYEIVLVKGDRIFNLTEKPVVIRFKDDVPMGIIIPHIILIFCAMLFSTRAGLEAFNPSPRFKLFSAWTLVFLILGGMLFGPITQLYAFGALWTGIPYGYDLTDNKTLIALIGWILAAIMVWKNSNSKRWMIFAAVLMFLVYLIPHSVLGSELDYSKLDKENKTEQKVGP